MLVLLGGLSLAQVATVPQKSSTSKRPAASAKPSSKSETTSAPMTDEEKTIYAIGLSIAKSLASLDLSPQELQIITRALTDSAAGKPAVKLDEWGPKIEPLTKARAARALEKQKSTSVAYINKTAAEPGAVKTDSGLVYREMIAGTGASPKASDTVKVNYRGTLIDGTEFDSSYRRNEPASFPLNGVIPCWTEGMQKMKVGGKATLVCPSNLAYGDDGRPGIPPGATLVFEVELLDVTPAAQ
jgi:FKBP-type peptidyl-prolyl cis-trans isomerase FkpA